MTKNAPVILETLSRLNPVSSICDAIREHQHQKTVRVELESSARRHEAEMATERKQIDFSIAELDNDFRKHKENMGFAREQLNAQVLIAQQQLTANENNFQELLKNSDKLIALGAADQAQMRTSMATMTDQLANNDLEEGAIIALANNLVRMAENLNQSHAQLEESHTRSLLAVQEMGKALQLGAGS